MKAIDWARTAGSAVFSSHEELMRTIDPQSRREERLSNALRLVLLAALLLCASLLGVLRLSAAEVRSREAGVSARTQLTRVASDDLPQARVMIAPEQADRGMHPKSTS